MFKKAASLLTACALCIGLAVPAFAAGYEAHTFTANDATVTFDAVSISKTTIKLGSMEGDPESKEVTMVTLKPDSKVTVKDNAGNGFVSLYGYTLNENGVYGMSMAAYELATGSVSNAFLGNSDLILQLSFDDKIYLKLGDGNSNSGTAAAEKPAEPTKPADTAPATTDDESGSITYSVKKYDTVGHLSVNYYGNYNYIQAIYNANKDAFKKTGGKLVPGMTLTLPATIAKGVNIIAAPVANEGEKLYTVKSGDTLGIIAQATYGNSNKYKAIYERNKDRLKSAAMIYEGQVIVLPAK